MSRAPVADTITDKNLGRLEKVEAKMYWQTEARHFTPWLAEEGNIKLLGDAIGLELEVRSREQPVGPYRADLVCVDTTTSRTVLIENQLEHTDHVHLGQILTYAAGLDAVSIVWIADRFTDQHRAALDWLNRITEASISFFGLEIELWRIGDSPLAPKFNVVAKPNEWIAPPPPPDLTETQRLYLEYWTVFREYLVEKKSPVHIGKPPFDHWMIFAIGKATFCLSAAISRTKKSMAVMLVLYGPNRIAHFHLLKKEREAIEHGLGGTGIEWKEMPEKKESQIKRNFDAVDPADKQDWPRQHEMMNKALTSFHRTFSPRVHALDAGDWNGEVDGD